MKNAKISNCKDAVMNTFNEANEFIKLVESKPYEKNDMISQLPLVINCIFACELYLKVLLLHNGYTSNELKKIGHNLSSLFLKWPSDKKNEINVWMKCFYQQDIFLLLDKIKNDFIDLRYMYMDHKVKKFDLYIIVQFTYKMQFEVSKELTGFDIKKNECHNQISEEIIKKFYAYSLFGKVSNCIESSVKRAYRDFNRTIRGFKANVEHNRIYDNAIQIMIDEINNLIISNMNSQREFDEWHKNLCDALIQSFEDQKLYYGQTQKWINMSLKYLAILDYTKVAKNYIFFHIPIDNYILEHEEELNRFKCTWSRIDDYDLYLEFQKEFRKKYNGAPLENEFLIWLYCVNMKK
ncbi:MAG: hypothetical protein Q4D02_03880 [Clostridia bacterium]|nr:hypothetical protein [Clostridia bacterium]